MYSSYHINPSSIKGPKRFIKIVGGNKHHYKCLKSTDRNDIPYIKNIGIKKVHSRIDKGEWVKI